MQHSFVGRALELRLMEEAVRAASGATLIVIKGRRRIGKSTLATQFAGTRRFIQFIGLAPVSGISAQSQRDLVIKQARDQLKCSLSSTDDWSEIFTRIAKKLPRTPCVLLFDEISWLAQDDSSFIPKFKTFWDRELKAHKNLVVILSGSVSTWIEKNILKSTALFGRINLAITLKELSISESNALLKSKKCRLSAYETFLTLSLTGGVPWYLEQISPKQSALENINRLCFSRNGALIEEFDRVFNDLFSSRGNIYRKIVLLLAQGPRELMQIRSELSYSSGGALSEYVHNLVESGFLEKTPLWSFHTGKASSRMLYRLKDSYLRFFLRFIEPIVDRIAASEVSDLRGFYPDNWRSLFSLQVENLIINNRAWIIEKLALNETDILLAGPFQRRATKALAGVQVDYLIQTRLKTLFVCEVKFSTAILGREVIEEVEEKLQRLKAPRGFAVVPVLIKFGEVARTVEKEGFFYRILDMSEMLE
jgi:AAA+ ATPase superfamily predicted ATPase